MDVIKGKRFLGKFRCDTVASMMTAQAYMMICSSGLACALANTTRYYESIIAHRFPGTHVAEVLVVALGFAFRSLAFFAEVAAARFLAVQGVESEDFGELEEVSHAAGAFQVLVEGTFGTEHVDVFPEFGTEGRNLLESGLQAGFVTSHAHVFPHDVTEFTMDIVNSAGTLDGEELVDAFFGLLLAVFERGIGLLAMGVPQPHTTLSSPRGGGGSYNHTEWMGWVGLYFMGCPVRSTPAQPPKTETTV